MNEEINFKGRCSNWQGAKAAQWSDSNTNPFKSIAEAIDKERSERINKLKGKRGTLRREIYELYSFLHRIKMFINNLF